MSTLDLVEDLKRQGVRFQWTGSGIRAHGNLERLNSDYKHAIASELEEFTALVKWHTLQDECEEQFGHQGARFYPFFRIQMTDSLLLRTTKGPARLAQIMPDHLRVVMEGGQDDCQAKCTWGKGSLSHARTVRMEFDEVFPPADPPPIELLRGEAFA